MTFNQYLLRLPNPEFIKKYGKRTNGLAGRRLDDLTEFPYQYIKHDLPALLDKQQFDKAFKQLLKIPSWRYRFVRNKHKLQFLLWINDQYKLLSQLEQQYLSTTPKADWIAAGIRKLDSMGDFPLIHAIAQNNPLQHNAIRQLPYSTIFDIQYYNRLTQEINDAYTEIQRQKSKKK